MRGEGRCWGLMGGGLFDCEVGPRPTGLRGLSCRCVWGRDHGRRSVVFWRSWALPLPLGWPLLMMEAGAFSAGWVR